LSGDWRNDPEQVEQAIREARAIIDYLDMLIVDTLVHRATVVRDIHNMKRQHGLPVRDRTREADLAMYRYHRERGYDMKTLHTIFQALCDASETLR
jgi:chorismate mutase